MPDNGTYSEQVAELEYPLAVRDALLRAVAKLQEAHAMASCRRGGLEGLNGSTRDLIYGLATTVETLANMITNLEAEWAPARYHR